MKTTKNASKRTTKTPSNSETESTRKRKGDDKWPVIEWLPERGKWRVNARFMLNGKRAGERRMFETREHADVFREKQRLMRHNEGASAYDQAGELSRYGWTVRKAIEFALDHLRAVEKSRPLAEVVDALIEAKRQAGRNEDYLKFRLENNLKGKLLAGFPGATLADINRESLAAWLAGLDCSASTKNTVRQDLVTLWTFAIKNGWAETNVPQALDETDDDLDNVSVIRPRDLAALLHHAQGHVRAFVALGAFSGLRTAEIARLDWQDIDLEEGRIEISRAVAKRTRSRARRVAPIPENAAAWLAGVAKPSGPVIEANFQREFRKARAEAGLQDWPRNVLRHSFVSHRLAHTDDAARTALEAGHSEAILFKHYRQLVTRRQAEAYFGIMPDVDDKVVPLRKSA